MAVSGAPPQQDAELPTHVGAVLAGKYRVDRVLGKGGMGVVVEASHLALHERVALKFLLPESIKNPEAVERFLREARAAVKIKSEHVARVSDVGTLDNGSPYMVMEFLEGQDLSRLIEKCGVLSVADAADYIIQGCEAFAEAHGHGIIHRDIKPANLFLTRRPDGTPLIKVLDFGISKRMDGVDNLTRTSAAMGSALYMSPEQMQQTRSVDHRTDIYALGISLFELLTGTQPFFAETLPQLCANVLMGAPRELRELRPDIPQQLEAVVHKAFARDKAYRYQTVAEFVSALAPFAPERSRPTIERILRMAGVELPLPPRPSYPSVPPANSPTLGPGQTTALNRASPVYPVTNAHQQTTDPLPYGYGPAAQTGVAHVPAVTALPPPRTFTSMEGASARPSLTQQGPFGTEPIAAMTRASAPAPAPPIPIATSAPPPPPGFSTSVGVSSERRPSLPQATKKPGSPIAFIIVGGACIAALAAGVLIWVFSGSKTEHAGGPSPENNNPAASSSGVVVTPLQSHAAAASATAPAAAESAAKISAPAGAESTASTAAPLLSVAAPLQIPHTSPTPTLKTGALKAIPTASPSASRQENHGVLSKTR